MPKPPNTRKSQSLVREFLFLLIEKMRRAVKSDRFDKSFSSVEYFTFKHFSKSLLSKQMKELDFKFPFLKIKNAL